MLDDFMRANFFAEEIQYCVSVLKDRRDVWFLLLLFFFSLQPYDPGVL